MTISEKGIKISPLYYQKDWQNLKLSAASSPDWNIAIEIFKDRMEGRFLKQIKVLDDNPDRKIGTYSGFAIMSLVCLFIETLEQFWNGNITTQKITRIKLSFFARILKKGTANEIDNDSQAFYNFFQRSAVLKLFFDTPEKARVFYSQIRCGLLHQAQTKGKSTIHIKSGKPALAWVDNSNFNAGISVHRRKFMKEVIGIYESFIKELENPTTKNFRNKTLGRKMNNIVNQF